MTVTAEKLPNEAIVIMHFSEPFDGVADLDTANELMGQYLAECGGYACRIEDITELNFDFAKMTTGLGHATKRVSGSMSDPNVYSLMVGNDDLSEMTAQAFSQEQYGGKNTPYFTDLNEAIADARAHLANR